METTNIIRVSIVLRRQMENSERIIKVARELFARMGLRCVSMDDIAQNLGMSKKTLYQFYEHKDAIVTEGVKHDLLQAKTELLNIKLSAQDAVHEIVLTMDYMQELFLTRFNPVMFHDMQKYYPHVWEMFGDYRHRFMNDLLLENLYRGVKEGVYREDLNVPVIVKLHITQMRCATESGAFPLKGFDFKVVHIEYVKMFLYGIASIKGHKLINKYMDKKEHYPLTHKTV